MQFIVVERVSANPGKYSVKPQKVTELMELINLDGLLNPTIFNWQLNLILGLHRFVACKILKLKQIQYNIITNKTTQIEPLVKTDESLSQNESNSRQRAEWQESDLILKQIESKTLLEDNCSRGGEIITQPSKTTDLIQEVRYTQQTFQHSQQIVRKLPEVKEELKSTKIVKSDRAIIDEINVQTGDRWFLEPHLIYCGDTSSDVFINSLPSNTALAIATPSPSWNHDYLINEARVVAVLRSEGYVHELCRHHRMTFRFELLISNIYVGIFSRQSIPKPQRPIEIEGLEGIVSYLVNLYTERGNSVILPFLGAGEVLVACERMGRICFAGDENPRSTSRAIARWQNLTGKQPYRLFYRS